MVLVYAESQDGKFKKAALEAVAYGHATAKVVGGECAVVVIGNADGAAALGQYGASAVHHISSDNLGHFDSQTYAAALSGAATALGAKVVVLPHNSAGKSLVGRIAVKLNAGCVTAANAVPTNDGAFKVKKNVFAGKAIADYQIDSDIKVLTLSGNSIKPEVIGADVAVSPLSVDVPASKIKVVSTNKQQGDTAPLPEAELVVSAGRGMKDPGNWGIIEDLAKSLGATTACSRPVADIGWRPHHEHVGQTGVAIKPNLYIAAGISGAIQHLAGVNSSKCIVVINKDPEAPFFKAADYGVCADLFDVVPKLTEAIKKAKA